MELLALPGVPHDLGQKVIEAAQAEKEAAHRHRYLRGRTGQRRNTHAAGTHGRIGPDRRSLVGALFALLRMLFGFFMALALLGLATEGQESLQRESFSVVRYLLMIAAGLMFVVAAVSGWSNLRAAFAAGRASRY